MNAAASFKQTQSLEERLADEAQHLRLQADALAFGPDREAI